MGTPGCPYLRGVYIFMTPAVEYNVAVVAISRNGTERNGTKVYNAERNWSKIRNATDVPISVVYAFVSLFGNFVYKYCN